MPRPRDHDEGTRSRLLKVAELRLGEEGAEALSTRRLAEEAGTTTRAIYSLFGSKQGLVRALYRIGFERLDAELASVATGDDPIRELHDLGLAYRRAALAHANLYDLMFGRPAQGFEPAADDYLFARSTLERVRGAVDRGVEGGRLGCDVETGTMLLWALVHGLASFEVSGVPSAISFDRLWDTGLRTTLSGLQRREGRL